MTHSFSSGTTLDLIKNSLTSKSAEGEITNVCGQEKKYLTLR